MAYKITVLKPFIEQRSGKSYQPGDEVTDPQWHDPQDGLRRARAYEARGRVRIEEIVESEAPSSSRRRAKTGE